MHIFGVLTNSCSVYPFTCLFRYFVIAFQVVQFIETCVFPHSLVTQLNFFIGFLITYLFFSYLCLLDNAEMELLPFFICSFYFQLVVQLLWTFSFLFRCLLVLLWFPFIRFRQCWSRDSVRKVLQSLVPQHHRPWYTTISSINNFIPNNQITMP